MFFYLIFCEIVCSYYISHKPACPPSTGKPAGRDPAKVAGQAAIQIIIAMISNDLEDSSSFSQYSENQTF
jgi:hypothetical protein